MKKGIVLFLLFAFTYLGKAQCNFDPIVEKCNSNLRGFTFLKSYKIDKSKFEDGEVEFSYVFSGNTNYILTLCDKNGEDPNFEVAIYNSDRKKVASNKAKGKIYSALTYNCKSTGIYYLTFKSKDSFECGASVLGFKK